MKYQRYRSFRNEPGCAAYLVAFGLLLIIGFAADAAVAFVVTWLWNITVAPTFGWPHLTFWVTFGIGMLLWLFLKWIKS